LIKAKTEPLLLRMSRLCFIEEIKHHLKHKNAKLTGEEKLRRYLHRILLQQKYRIAIFTSYCCGWVVSPVPLVSVLFMLVSVPIVEGLVVVVVSVPVVVVVGSGVLQ
jgi:hypothetical protein